MRGCCSDNGCLVTTSPRKQWETGRLWAGWVEGEYYESARWKGSLLPASLTSSVPQKFPPEEGTTPTVLVSRGVLSVSFTPFFTSPKLQRNVFHKDMQLMIHVKFSLFPGQYLLNLFCRVFFSFIFYKQVIGVFLSLFTHCTNKIQWLKGTLCSVMMFWHHVAAFVVHVLIQTQVQAQVCFIGHNQKQCFYRVRQVLLQV